MSFSECRFEEEVLAGRVDAELCAHLEQCASCAELATVAAAIGEARDAIPGAVTIPDSGRVWRVAQLRARREAIKDAGRPITAAHVIALACAAGLAGACFGATSAWFQAALSRAGSRFAFVPSAAQLVIEHGMLAAGLAVMLFLVPAAIYLAMGRD